MDTKLEGVIIPVSDVDRAKQFYGRLGWRLDADFPFDNGVRIVQFTPPGSGSSIQFGAKVTSAAPGSAQGLYLIVSDIEAARGELTACGAQVSEVFHAGTPGAQSSPTVRAAARAVPRPITPATAPSPRSATRMATAGCCKRSRRGCPAGSTPRRRPSHPRLTWRTRCDARRPRTASMRSASERLTRTGLTGMPRTWRQSRRGRSCRCERL